MNSPEWALTQSPEINLKKRLCPTFSKAVTDSVRLTLIRCGPKTNVNETELSFNVKRCHYFEWHSADSHKLVDVHFVDELKVFGKINFPMRPLSTLFWSGTVLIGQLSLETQVQSKYRLQQFLPDLTPICEFSGLSSSAISGKSKNIACDVTIETKNT